MGKFHDYIYQGFKYKLYVPKNYIAKKEFPLMVLLHGCGQDPDDFAAGTKMNSLAEQENFLVLYPNMNHLLNPSDPAGYNPFGCWNWFLDKNQHRGQGHPKLIYEIIEEVKRGYNIDSNKVYAAGLSAGGSLACILGVTYPDVFDAIGICSGLAYDAANVFFLTDPMAEDAKKSMEKGVHDPFACGNSAFAEMGEFKKKMRVIVFHGICDTTVHPINGQQVITQWAQTNFLVGGGKGTADITPTLVNASIINKKSYTQQIYKDDNGEPLLEYWMVDNLGHAWSGGSPNGSYTYPLGPNATEIIWNFFEKRAPYTEEKPEESTINSAHEPPRLLVPPPDKIEMQIPLLEQSQVVPPFQSADHSPVETLAESPEYSPAVTLVHSPDFSPAEEPVHSADQLPAEQTALALVKPINESNAKRNDGLQKKSPKKKLLITLLSKFTKKKS